MGTVRRLTASASRASTPPPQSGVRLPWLLITGGLALVAVLCVTLIPVCEPDKPGVDEQGFGVRHRQRGASWDHCEPWLGRVLSDWTG